MSLYDVDKSQVTRLSHVTNLRLKYSWHSRMRSAFGPQVARRVSKLGRLPYPNSMANKFAVADHVHTFITGWIGILEVQIRVAENIPAW
jgi:hypothetical protein